MLRFELFCPLPLFYLSHISGVELTVYFLRIEIVIMINPMSANVHQSVPLLILKECISITSLHEIQDFKEISMFNF